MAHVNIIVLVLLFVKLFIVTSFWPNIGQLKYIFVGSCYSGSSFTSGYITSSTIDYKKWNQSAASKYLEHSNSVWLIMT